MMMAMMKAHVMQNVDKYWCCAQQIYGLVWKAWCGRPYPFWRCRRPLNSRPLPMKHLVICILSLVEPASNPPQLIHAIRSRVRHLAPRCVLRSRSGHNGKRGSPTCKCGDWCFLSWRLQCGSYQDLLIPTLGLRSPILILIFLARRREHRWWWEWRWRWWQSQERKVEKWPPKAVDSQSVPWAAGAHSQPSEDVSLFSFFLWQEQL